MPVSGWHEERANSRPHEVSPSDRPTYLEQVEDTAEAAVDGRVRLGAFLVALLLLLSCLVQQGGAAPSPAPPLRADSRGERVESLPCRLAVQNTAGREGREGVALRVAGMQGPVPRRLFLTSPSNDPG